MATGIVLYNKLAGTGGSYEEAKNLENLLNDDLKYIDVSHISDYQELINGLGEDDYIVVAGGDGTLNRFANEVYHMDFANDVLYFPNGTGNDFAHDLGHAKGQMPFSVKEYIKGLPEVTVKDKTVHFVNGIGYGIDGYCCEVGDELKKIPGKKIDYTAIAIKGVLFKYKPTKAKVTVDGKVHTYKKVWIAPTMNGRFYGGGMMPTPDQKRNSGELTVMVLHSTGRLKTLMIFPSIFKGEHVNYKKHVEVLTGKEITVEFDRPVSLQIDGETVLNVSSYHACASKVRNLEFVNS